MLAVLCTPLSGAFKETLSEMTLRECVSIAGQPEDAILRSDGHEDVRRGSVLSERPEQSVLAGALWPVCAQARAVSLLVAFRKSCTSLSVSASDTAAACCSKNSCCL